MSVGIRQLRAVARVRGSYVIADIGESECRATPEAIAVRGGKTTVTEIG
jgi:hypothetical protein